MVVQNYEKVKLDWAWNLGHVSKSVKNYGVLEPKSITFVFTIKGSMSYALEGLRHFFLILSSAIFIQKPPMNNQKLIIFTAPSGAGKTTIVRHLLKTRKDIAFSISACTRPPRYGEVNGMDYYFLSADEFKRKVGQNEFVEYEEVYDNQYYGTLRSEIERLWREGKHVLFDIDVKGARSIKEAYGTRALSVFVKPPSFEILKQRLINRKTEDERSLRKRINRVKEEMTYERLFDVTLINSDLDTALVDAERLVAQFLAAEQELI